MAAMSRVRESRAAFVEEKELAVLAAPLTSRGTLHYVAPTSLEKHTTGPVEERILVEGDRLTWTKPAEGARYTLSLDQAPELRGLVEAVRGTLAGDVAALRRYYSVGLEGPEDAWRLTLVPTDERVKALLKVVRVEGSGTDLRRVETVEADGDVSTMTIEAARPG